MKIVKMLFCLFFLLISLAAFAKQVPTEGRWWSKHKSIEGLSPLEIFLREENKTICVYVYADLGYLNITLYNSMGDIVYSQVIEAVAYTSNEISFENLPEENYTISISDGINEIKGNFFIY